MNYNIETLESGPDHVQVMSRSFSGHVQVMYRSSQISRSGPGADSIVALTWLNLSELDSVDLHLVFIVNTSRGM